MQPLLSDSGGQELTVVMLPNASSNYTDRLATASIGLNSRQLLMDAYGQTTTIIPAVANATTTRAAGCLTGRMTCENHDDCCSKRCFAAKKKCAAKSQSTTTETDTNANSVQDTGVNDPYIQPELVSERGSAAWTVLLIMSILTSQLITWRARTYSTVAPSAKHELLTSLYENDDDTGNGNMPDSMEMDRFYVDEDDVVFSRRR